MIANVADNTLNRSNWLPNVGVRRASYLPDRFEDRSLAAPIASQHATLFYSARFGAEIKSAVAALAPGNVEALAGDMVRDKPTGELGR